MKNEEFWSYDFLILNYELRITSYSRRAAIINYELRIIKFK